MNDQNSLITDGDTSYNLADAHLLKAESEKITESLPYYEHPFLLTVLEVIAWLNQYTTEKANTVMVTARFTGIGKLTTGLDLINEAFEVLSNFGLIVIDNAQSDVLTAELTEDGRRRLYAENRWPVRENPFIGPSPIAIYRQQIPAERSELYWSYYRKNGLPLQLRYGPAISHFNIDRYDQTTVMTLVGAILMYIREPERIHPYDLKHLKALLGAR